MPAATPLSSPYLSHSNGIAKYEVVDIVKINPTIYAIKFKNSFCIEFGFIAGFLLF